MNNHTSNGIQLKDIFQLIYHSSLLGGSILSILYFTFYAEIFPSINNLSQLGSYVVTIFGVALFLVSYLSLAMITPSLTVLSYNLNKRKKNQILLGYIIISFFIVLSICTEKLFFLFGLLILIGIPLFKLEKNWTIKLIFKKHIFTIKHTKFYSKILYIYSISWLLYFVFSILFLLIFVNNNDNNDKALIDISIIFIQIMILFANAYIIRENKAFQEPQNNLKKIFNIMLVLLMLFISIISIVFIYTKKSNPIVIAPFSLLKLGYYTSELHFKEEFIKKHPFPTDSNSTINTFFVLSSIGDEYIISSTPLYKVKKVDENKTIKIGNIISKADNKIYWYNDQNHSIIWSNSYLTNEVNLTVAQNLQDEINQNQFKPYRIYRIKKENVDFEIVGKEINQQSTIWEIKSPIKPKGIIIPPKNNQQKPKKHCVSNISIQSCYCSYPNNNLLQTSQP